MHFFYVAATWFDVTSLCAAVGAVMCLLWVVPEPAGTPVAGALRRGLGAGLALLTAATLALVVARTLEMSGAGWGGLGRFLPLVVMKTRFGALWGARMVALAAAWVCAGAYLRGGWGRRVGAAGLAAACATVAFARAVTGHAGDAGMFAVPVWVDAVHLLAAGAWVGPLFVLSVFVFPQPRGPGSAEVFADLYDRLSILATAALFAVVATGLYNTWRGLDRVQELWTTPYGRILVVKVALVAVMVSLGAYNRFVVRPALRHVSRVGGKAGAWIVRAARIVALEAMLAVGVLYAAALLHHALPPSDRHPLRAAHEAVWVRAGDAALLV